MKKNKHQLILLLIALLGNNFCIAQIKGVVQNSETQLPIPYTNIWIVGENIGTTSDENGQFILEHIDSQKTIVFSGIGYQTLEIMLSKGNHTVTLSPQNIVLPEALVTAEKAVKTTKLGGYKKSKINFYFGSNAQPVIRARYFPFDIAHENTLIKEVSIHTRSEVKDARFHVRLYAADEQGQPGAFLHDKVIKGIAKKGNQATSINLSTLDLTFPKEGVFVAIEWLIIEQNQYWTKGKDVETGQKTKEIAYAPLFGIVTSEQNENSWIFENGQWQKVERNPDYLGKKERNKFSVVAMEMVLIK